MPLSGVKRPDPGNHLSTHKTPTRHLRLPGRVFRCATDQSCDSSPPTPPSGDWYSAFWFFAERRCRMPTPADRAWGDRQNSFNAGGEIHHRQGHPGRRGWGVGPCLGCWSIGPCLGTLFVESAIKGTQKGKGTKGKKSLRTGSSNCGIIDPPGCLPCRRPVTIKSPDSSKVDCQYVFSNGQADDA